MAYLHKHDNATSTSFKLKLKMDLWNVFETGEPHLKKLVIMNHQLVVFMQHDPGELRGLQGWALAKFNSPCMMVKQPGAGAERFMGRSERLAGRFKNALLCLTKITRVTHQ